MSRKDDQDKKGTQRSRFSDQEIFYVYEAFNGSRAKAAKYWGVPEKTVSNWFLEIEKDPETQKRKEKYEKQLYVTRPNSTLSIVPKPKSIYVVTSATNNTPIHRNFFKSLLTYCNYRNAQLVVVPIRYKNVTAYTSPKDYKVEWPADLQPYYLNDKLFVNNNLIIVGTQKTQATAVNPLDIKLGAMAQGKSAVIGHPQIAMRMVATPRSEYSRQLISTGSISEKSYAICPTGDYADFNHSFGAIVVEVIDEEKFNTRILNATDDGTFFDVDVKSKSIAKFYPSGTVETGYRAEALICGDLHAWFLDPKVKEATWINENSIFNICKPKHQFIHDAHDHYSQNHHHRNDPFQKFKKIKEGKWSVEDELNCLLTIHNTFFQNPNCIYHYIASNHNDALLRWLKEVDWRSDLHNAEIQIDLISLMLKNDLQHPLYLWMRDKITNPENTLFHNRNEKIEIHGIELGQHGDIGPNGAKGSARAFVNAGFKLILGHSHVPTVIRGVYQVGTSSLLELDYNNGYSSWFHTHCIILPNGKRMLLNIIDGDWLLDI